MGFMRAASSLFRGVSLAAVGAAGGGRGGSLITPPLSRALYSLAAVGAAGGGQGGSLITPLSRAFQKWMCNSIEGTKTDSDVSPNSVKEIPSQHLEDTLGEKQNYRLVSASAMLPQAGKAATGGLGEDAFFITDNNWIGVADGVGGWVALGIDAGLYSRELMSNCEDVARQSDENSKPQDILARAHSRTCSKGSATAIVAMLRGKTLEVSNVGDSGFLVIRKGKVVARSTPMQSSFNCPCQLAHGSPQKSDNYSVPLEKGDVVVLGTDGFFDNLFENQIVESVDAFKEGPGADPKVVANSLVMLAQQVSKTCSGSSPFAVAVKEASALRYSYTGGKEDDITVVVSYVT